MLIVADLVSLMNQYSKFQNKEISWFGFIKMDSYRSTNCF